MTTDLATRPAGALIAADLDAAFADFLRLNVAEGDASPNTIRAYWTHAGQYAAWCAAEGIDPRAADENTITEYRRYLVKQEYKRDTIAVKLQAVGRLYEAMLWRGLRADNPAAGIKPPTDKTAPEDKIKFLPLAALPRLLELCNPSTARGWRDRAMVALMAKKGLRVAEVAGLTLDALELDRDPPQVTVTGKGKRSRTVYLTPAIAAVLAGWLERRAAVAAEGERALFVTLHPNPHQAAGGPISARSARRAIDRLLERAGLKREGISCHSLRHTFATWSVAGGASIPAVSADLGHSNIATTGVYAKIADKIKGNPTAYLEALLEELGE